MSSKKKNILNIGFLVLLLVLTFWLVFRDQDLGPIVEILGKVPIHFIFIGLVLVVCYVCGESVIIKYLLHAVKIKAPLINCIRYSFVGFFFSCITPSATGGQPAQIFYMQRQKIDIPTASIILMLVTIEYKFVLVFIGLALALFGQPLVQTLPPEAQFYLYLAIGGMPLSILEYRKEKKLLMVPDVQQKLLNLFLEDITAHAPSNYTRYCRNCWQSIPAQIGKSNSKFQYRCIAKGATARLYQKPLQWLIDSGLACAVPRHSFSASSLVYSDSNTVSEIPNSGADSEFFYHIYFPDIGLCARQIHASSYLLLSGENNTAKHICTETFLAQHFFQNGYELSFWSGKNQAALPFLLKKDNLYIAIDYRLSPSQKQRNLARFKELYKDSQNLEFYLLSTEDFKQKEAYDIVPLYAGFCI